MKSLSFNLLLHPALIMNTLILFFIMAFAASISVVSGFQFKVGDEMGWKKPTGKERETYNEWAAQNRFHIGDSLHFKYVRDSVLVVSSADYSACNTSNPISRFAGGDAVYEFHRSGLFYFISGIPGHCRSGQRLIVRVIHPSAPDLAPSPAPAPAPAPSTDEESHGDSGQPGVRSAATLSVVSFFVTAFAALLLVLYLFM